MGTIWVYLPMTQRKRMKYTEMFGQNSFMSSLVNLFINYPIYLVYTRGATIMCLGIWYIVSEATFCYVIDFDISQWTVVHRVTQKKMKNNAYVWSKLEFAAVIWDPSQQIYQDDIESIQKSFIIYSYIRR